MPNNNNNRLQAQQPPSPGPSSLDIAIYPSLALCPCSGVVDSVSNPPVPFLPWTTTTQSPRVLSKLARHRLPAGRGGRCVMVPVLPVELDGPGTALDLEPKEVAQPPDRPHRSHRWQGAHARWRRHRTTTDVLPGGGPVVPAGEEGLLDLLRRREAGAADTAVQVYGRRELGASRVPAHVAGGELCKGRRGGAQVQGVRCTVRDQEDEQVSRGGLMGKEAGLVLNGFYSVSVEKERKWTKVLFEVMK